MCFEGAGPPPSLCVQRLVAQTQRAEADGEDDKGRARFREVLRDVQSELVASKRNVWEHISQQVSLVLITLEFQYPALSEDPAHRLGPFCSAPFSAEPPH